MKWVVSSSERLRLVLVAILTVMIPSTATAHPHPKYDVEDRYQGFTDGAEAPCPSNPLKSHDWHDVTGSSGKPVHDIKKCCWCGQQRFVDVRVIGKQSGKKYDTTGILHGTVDLTPTDYSGVNSPAPFFNLAPLAGDP